MKTEGGANKLSAALGDMLWLYSLSEIHQSWPIASLHKWLLPPLERGQYRLYHQGQRPVGFVTWAWMSEQVEQEYIHKKGALDKHQWKTGDRIWIIDFIAPFGHAWMIAEDLRQNRFSTDIGRFLRVKPGTERMRIAYVHGVNAIAKARDTNLNTPVLT
ncbi:toxin-activating lysine-acyltransferase [Yoonia sp. GPGPB17]|uniref:toxin-activating lysine-acyltransferase n=1 Tax=Yoonia sp. GPGPB17 TaxID=3026147 RepID=UPI0030BE5FE8